MTPRQIVVAVSASTGASVADILGPKRWKWQVNARRLAAQQMRAMGMSYQSIGQQLGGRHHATVMNLLGVLRSPEARHAAKVRDALMGAAIGSAVASVMQRGARA